MDAAVIVSSLRDKMKALLENKEVTPARLERNKIKRYLKDLHDGHELLTKQSDNKITLTDGLYSKLLRRAYEVEDIIDSFVLRAELQRQRMLTKMRSFIPLVSTCRQKSLSDELKKPMECLKDLLPKDKDTGKSHGTAESSASEEHQESVNKESTSHGQDADSAGQKISSTTGQSNSNEKITDPGPSVSGKKQAQTVAPQQWANIFDRFKEELEFVGLDDQVTELIKATLKRQKLRFLISVVGAAGSGKTTIVRTIYNKAEIVESFQYRAWVHVSKEFSEKDLLIDILKQVTTIKDEEKLPLEKLQERVRDVLISSRCLIVLDDVRTSDVQNLLKNTFINSLNGSRVILTVRDRKIIDAIDAEGKFSLEMRKANQFLKVWNCSRRDYEQDNRSEIPKMEQDNRRKMCLPLAIVVLAGLLSTNRTKQLVNVTDPSKGVLTLAYQDLPPHLKPCLLYLGLFPKEFVIPIRRLFRLWEAEGLVKCSNQGSPEEVSPEKMLQKVDFSLCTGARPRPLMLALRFLRRAAVYTDINKFQDEDLKHLRSYISFNKRKGDTPADEVNQLLQRLSKWNGFALITVLDLEHANCRLLKYLGLRWTFLDSIPKSVGDLPHLETLDVKHTNITCLPKSIWNSKKLQHLYMNNIHLDVPIRKQLPDESPPNLVTLRGLLIGKKRQ
uniref:Uncharacterized protein n=1 Tax=Salix viminalis TaxID=40686 RepID=A0A6N2MGC8_SALVM